MMPYSRRRGGILSFGAEVAMLICVVLLTIWCFTNYGRIRELLILNESTPDVSVTSYRELRAAFANPKVKTVRLSGDILMNEGTQLTISRDLLLIGGGFSFDAQSRDRHLLVLPQARLTVRDLTFKNGLLSGDAQLQGGSVFVSKGSKAYFERCTFEGNRVLSSQSAEGGAVFGGNYSQSRFLHNAAEGATAAGGAASGGEFRECRFERNQALASGDGSQALGGAANGGQFIDCFFLNNKSIADGDSFGGAANRGRFLNNFFRGNLAQSTRGAAHGGALSDAEGLNSTFFKNEAIASFSGKTHGGALWRGSYTNCTLTQNRAFLRSQGGQRGKPVASLDIAEQDSAPVLGGAAYAGTFTNCILTGNALSKDEVIGRDAFNASSSGGNVVGDAISSKFELGLNDFIGARAEDVFGANKPTKNGGAWDTLAIIPGSPAERRGINTPTVPPKDARGTHRSPLISDSGAYELTGQHLLTETEQSQQEEGSSIPPTNGSESDEPVQELKFGSDIFEWVAGQPIQEINLGDPEKMTPNLSAGEQAGGVWNLTKRFLGPPMRAINSMIRGNSAGDPATALRWHVERLPERLRFDMKSGKIRGTPLQPAEGEILVKLLKGSKTVGAGTLRYKIAD